MTFYYTGLNSGSLFAKNDEPPVILDELTKIPFDGLTDLEIGWDFMLLWKEGVLYISGKFREESENDLKELKVPNFSGRYKDAQIGMDSKVYILSESDEIWQYKVFENEYKKINNFLFTNEDSEKETIVKLISTRCTFALTNLGRVFSIPTLIDMPKGTKFVDVAVGFDHTIILSSNGDVYSMGMGTRGQLGHGDLEDCDSPRQIEALAGLKVTQISAGGWHSAVLTDQGDVYTWGWDTNGELGLENDGAKVIALPTVVDFKNEKRQPVELNIKKVQCGNNFTVCLTGDNAVWGCGSNKFGQLGQSVNNLKSSKVFIKLKMNLDEDKVISDIKCKAWGTCIIINS